MTTRTSYKALLAVVLTVLCVLPVTGCATFSGGEVDDGLQLTATFAKAPSFYEGANVKVMGIDVGQVDSVTVHDDHVEVSFHVREDVPLPQDVHAAIQQLNAIGERSLVLFPVYRSGPQAEDGDTIPLERTELPVEIDEALGAFTKLATALDPTAMRQLVDDGAALLKGRGQKLNDMLRTASDLTGILASHDADLLATAAQLRDLAASLNQRQVAIGNAIANFADVASMLAAERSRLTTFLRDLSVLVRQGKLLVDVHRSRIPRDLARMGELSLVLRANAESVRIAVERSARIGHVLLNAWDRENHTINVRLNNNGLIRAWLAPLLGELGLVPPCLPPPLSDCEEPR